MFTSTVKFTCKSHRSRQPKSRTWPLLLASATLLSLLSACEQWPPIPPTPDAAIPDAATPDRVPASTLNLPVTSERPDIAPWFTIHRPTNLDATGQPLPVVTWANGGCFRSDFTWAPLFQAWAAGGFVVLSLTDSAQAWALATTTVDDHRALVDWAFEANQDPQSPYYGKLDTGRIVAAGNSCGGVTALGLAAEDTRIKSVFVLSGSSAIPLSPPETRAAVMGAVSVPVGYIVGGEEDIARADANNDYDLLQPGVPALIISRSAGDHITVSTDATILADEAKLSLDWLDLALYGTPEAATTLRSATVCNGCEAGVWSVKSKYLDQLLQ